MKIRDTEIDVGRAVAYLGTVGGLGLSLWANIRDAFIPEIPQGVDGALWRGGATVADDKGVLHTYVAINPGLFDIVLAGFFPVALFLALELMTRVKWGSHWTHRLMRFMGVGSFAIVTGFISYSHLMKAFLLAGRSELLSLIAPLAVDGFMLICSMVLLMTAGHEVAPTPDPSHFRSYPAPPLGPPHGPPSPTARATPLGHPLGYPWATPPISLRATSGPVAGHPTEPPLSHPLGPPPAQREIAGQGPSHLSEPPPAQEVALPGPDATEPVAQPDPEPGAQDADEPLAQTGSSHPEPPTPSHPEPVDAKVAHALRLMADEGLSQRKAAEQSGASRAAIQRAVAAGQTAPPTRETGDEEVEREVGQLDDALERILAEGNGPDQA